MKKIVKLTLLSVLVGMTGFKLVAQNSPNPTKNINDSTLTSVKFGDNYKAIINKHYVEPNLIDQINYHDQNSGLLCPTGISNYANITTGDATNKLTKFHQSSSINPTIGTSDVYCLSKILIIELNYNTKFMIGEDSSIALCIVPHVAKNGNFNDQFSVWATTNFTYGDSNNLPNINNPIWQNILITKKASPKHASAGNGFNYKALLYDGTKLRLSMSLNNNPFSFSM